MKKAVKGLVSAALLTSVLPTGFTAHAQETATQTEELIIKYKDGESLSTKAKDKLDIESKTVAGESELIEVSVKDMNNVIEKLEAKDEVEYVTENTKYHIAAEETKEKDTYVDNQWNLKTIDAEGAWKEIDGNTNKVTVAVLDTGVSKTHEDLINRQSKAGETFVTTTGTTTTNGEDDHGHGTFVSGIIAAEANNGKGIAGVSGEANIDVLPVKVMNKSGSGEAFDIAAGIEYAIDQKVDVINMSLSGEYNQVIAEAVEHATEEGIVVVAAAGNGGGSADASFPAALDNVISVGSVAVKDQSIGTGSGISNVGSTVDVVAPGVNVTSTSLKGDLGSETSKYTTGTGTSYATPHVAAVAALYKVKNPNATIAQVEEALKETAVDLGATGRDDKTGYGRIDAKKALAYVSDSKITFSSPKANADVMGEIPLSINLLDTNVKSVQFKIGDKVVKEVNVTNQNAMMQFDTTKYADGTLNIVATAKNSVGESIQELTTSVNVRNNAKSGYMFNVVAPNASVAVGTSVKLYDKKDGKYEELWAGVTDSNGTIRVPSNVGTDLKDLKVIAQGKFDNGKSSFVYSRDVSSKGSISLQAENSQKVTLNTKDEKSAELKAQYFLTLKDIDGLAINGLDAINSSEGSEGTTLYADKGSYNIISYATKGDNTYFLTNSDAKVTEKTTNFTFDTKDAGEVKVDNTDGALENAILYLYNDDMNEALGEDTFVTGSKFYATPGEYNYIIDAEVANTESGENWIYHFGDYSHKAKVIKGQETGIKAGGEINLYPYAADQASVKQYSINRGVDYIERKNPLDAYITDQAFYTKQKFQDQSGNMLLGMQRGTLAGKAGALVKKDIITGETTLTTNDESEIQSKDFGDINPTLKVTRKSDKKVVAKTTARMFYSNAFFMLTGQNMTKGYYELNLSTVANPLMPSGLSESLTMNLTDSATVMKVKDQAGNSTKAYITLNTAVKDEHGDIEWNQIYGKNTDAKTNELTIPNTLAVSKEAGGNVAVIRYTVDGRYAYIYKAFDKIEDLDTIVIPSNMQEVKINVKDGENPYEQVGTKLWKFKKTFTVDGEESYLTVNNYQTYKYDSVYMEPGEVMVEGNYVSLPNANLEKDNLYFLQKFNVTEKENAEPNILEFDKAKLAKIKVEANTEGFTDLRGALVYPYNKYSDSFTSTLRTGHNFYFPTDLEMNIQVQLGYGDTENKSKIWNYFMTKGNQTFKAGQKTQTWKVGGDLSTKVNLSKTNFDVGSELSGTTEILDAHKNQLSSIVVDETSAYSTASTEEVASEYKLNRAGQIEKVASENSYTISHSTVPTAASNSVKPVISIVDEENKIIQKNSSLSYYAHINDVIVPTKKGSYKVQLQIAGSPLGVTTTEQNFTVGMADPKPTEKPLSVTVGKVSNNMTSVTGKTTPNATVTLKRANKVITTAKANAKGVYTLKFAKQYAGTELTIVSALNGEKATVEVVVADKIAPSIVSVVAKDNSTKVLVKTEANANIKLSIAGKVYTKKASKTGEYTFTIKKAKAGTKWSVVVTDAAGNSKKKTGVVLDRTAPKKIVVTTKVTTKTTAIKGKAEKKATVTLYVNGKKYRTVKANAKGDFKMPIAKQKANAKLSFYAIDVAGNKSKVTQQIVKK